MGKAVAVKFLFKPWCHFLLIGFALFFAKNNLPEEPVQISPPDDIRLAQYRSQWQSLAGKPPSDAEISSMIQFEIGREILFQEALKQNWHKVDQVVRQRLLKNMRFLSNDKSIDDSEDRLIEQALDLSLHQNDVVVRQRLIQIMELMAGLPFESATAPVDVLQQRYQLRKDEYYQAGNLNLRHIFIRHAPNVNGVAEAKRRLQKVLQEEKVSSDPFMHGLYFNKLDEHQAETYFGRDFQELLFAEAAEGREGRWLGPLRSAYGEHLVLIEQHQSRQALEFEQVAPKLESEWRREKQDEAIAQLIEELRPFYVVVKKEG